MYLALNRTRVVPIPELRQEVWGATRVSDATMHQAVAACRRAVGDDGRAQAVIRTIARTGYQFVADAEALGAGAPPSDYVGRASILEALDASVSAAAEGQGQILLLHGEPGIGKTRTLEFVERSGVARGALVARGTASPQAGSPVFWPWIQVFRSLAAGRPTSSLQEAFEAIMPGLLDERDLTDANESEPGARFRLFDAAVRCLCEASRLGPVIVLLDDLHRSGAASFELLELLANEIPRTSLLVVAAYRPFEATRSPARSDVLARLSAEPGVDRLDLPPLSAHESGELVRQHQRRALGAAVIEAVAAKASGNPFYLVELTRAVSASETDDTSTAVALAAGVQRTIEARIAAISPPALRLLQIAAICGDVIQRSTLDAALGARALEHGLEEVCRTGVLVDSALSRVASRSRTR